MQQTCDACAHEATTGDHGFRRRDWDVLCVLGHGDDAQIAFQGLRRRLDFHQETLRRTLRRLTRSGHVEKRPHGYGLTEKGYAVLDGVPLPRQERAGTPVANLLLPDGLAPSEVVEHLAGRWFGALRFHGLTQGPGEAGLIWETDDGARRLRLRIGLGSVTLETAGQAHPDDVSAVLSAVLGVVKEAAAGPPSGTLSASADAGYAA